MNERSPFSLSPDELRARFERALDLECDLDPMILRARQLRQQGSTPQAGIDTLIEQIPILAAYASEDGGIRPDKVSPQVLPLYPGTNDLLAGMLLDPAPPPVVDPGDKRGLPWYAWAGIGVAVAGGGGVAAAVLLSGEDEGPTGPAGTITVNLP